MNECNSASANVKSCGSTIELPVFYIPEDYIQPVDPQKSVKEVYNKHGERLNQLIDLANIERSLVWAMRRMDKATKQDKTEFKNRINNILKEIK